MDKVRAFFVLGGPGVGKGTVCTRLVESLPHYTHLSAGALLRDMGSDHVTSLLNSGKIVPSHVTIKLLRKRMVEQGWNVSFMQAKTFLIDGFPRNLENYNGWKELMPDTQVLGCLYLKASVDVMAERVLGRKEGRSDDNKEGILKRIHTFHAETEPMIEEFRKLGLLKEVNAEQQIEGVWKQALSLLR